MHITNFPKIVFATSKVSDGNMSIYRGDINQAIKNKEKFFHTLNIDPRNVVELEQIHGKKIIKLDKVVTKIKEGDGLVTNKQGIYLMIKAADCNQIAFFDVKNNAIALIHAGAKGLENGIIKKTVVSLKKYFGSNPKDLIIQFGPSIGPCCYRIDIWQEAKNQLIACGILEKNIDNPRICTYENKDYFSHRQAENEKLPEDFRFATILGLKLKL